MYTPFKFITKRQERFISQLPSSEVMAMMNQLTFGLLRDAFYPSEI